MEVWAGAVHTAWDATVIAADCVQCVLLGTEQSCRRTLTKPLNPWLRTLTFGAPAWSSAASRLNSLQRSRFISHLSRCLGGSPAAAAMAGAGALNAHRHRRGPGLQCCFHLGRAPVCAEWAAHLAERTVHDDRVFAGQVLLDGVFNVVIVLEYQN